MKIPQVGSTAKCLVKDCEGAIEEVDCTVLGYTIDSRGMRSGGIIIEHPDPPYRLQACYYFSDGGVL